MIERRNLRMIAYLGVAILGGIGLALAAFVAMGHVDLKSPNPLRILGGTLAIALAMFWACWFSVRAHFAEDEFQRQREIYVSFWGGWLGLGASAPVFFFIAVGGLHWLDPVVPANAQSFRAFVVGYLLPIACAVLGVAAAGLWRRVAKR